MDRSLLNIIEGHFPARPFEMHEEPNLLRPFIKQELNDFHPPKFDSRITKLEIINKLNIDNIYPNRQPDLGFDRGINMLRTHPEYREATFEELVRDLGRIALRAEFRAIDPDLAEPVVPMFQIREFPWKTGLLDPVGVPTEPLDLSDPVGLAERAGNMPGGWSKKRTGYVIKERLEAGVDKDITAASRWLECFNCPDFIDGEPTTSPGDELTVLLSTIYGQAPEKLPSKQATIKLIFRSEAASKAYEFLRTKSKVDFPTILEAEEIVAVDGLPTELRRLFEAGQGAIPAKEQSGAIQNLKVAGRLRQAYNTQAQDWLRTHSTTPEDLLTFAWQNRRIALKKGVADNPGAIKKWCDQNQLTVDLTKKQAAGELPIDFDPDLLGRYRPYVDELLLYYREKNFSAPSDPAQTIIRTIMRHEQIFNPDHLIEPAKITLQDGWTAEILEKDDPRGYMLGYKTDCCMHPNGEARSCVEAAYSDPRYGLLALYDENGVLAAHSLLYTDPDAAPEVLVADNIESASGRNRDSIADRYRQFFDVYIQGSPDQPQEFREIRLGVHSTERYRDFTKEASKVVTPLSGTYSDTYSMVYLWESDQSSNNPLDFFVIRKGEEYLVQELERKIYPDLEGDLDFTRVTDDSSSTVVAYNYFIVDPQSSETIGYVLASQGEMMYQGTEDKV